MRARSPMPDGLVLGRWDVADRAALVGVGLPAIQPKTVVQACVWVQWWARSAGSGIVMVGSPQMREEAVGTIHERIVVDPQICGGKPSIRGTRIMVKNILGMLAGGYTMDQILRAYPELSREDVVAALDYASAVVDEEKVVAFGA